MYVGTARDPDCLKPRMSQHVVVVVINGDAEVVVLLVGCGPFNLASIGTADCHHLCPWDSVEQCMHMALALDIH